MIRLIGSIKRVPVLILEERKVRMHSATVLHRQRLGHECRMNSDPLSHLFDEPLVGHESICHCHRFSIFEINFMLTRPDLMVRVLHRDPHRLETEDRGFPKVVPRVYRVQVKISGLIQEKRLIL